MFYCRQNALTALVGELNYDIPKMSAKFQPYLASCIVTVDLNLERSLTAVLPMAKVRGAGADMLFPVLNFDDLNAVVRDMDTVFSACDFWGDAEAAGTNLLGYVAPSGAASRSIPSTKGDPSRILL
jgi:hypothetical protein